MAIDTLPRVTRGGHLAYADLRDWIRHIDAMGQLKTVHGANVDEDIGQATDVLHHTPGSPAAIFENVAGYRPGFRVLVNSFNTHPRIAFTLGIPHDVPLAEMQEAWRKRLHAFQPVAPVEVSDGPVMANVMRGDDVNVLIFPAPKWHPMDGGRYLGTGSFDVTRDPDEGWVNCGTYRVMVHNEKQVGYYISPGKHGRIQRQKYFDRGEPCPVAMVIGSHPLMFLASCTEIPYGLSEFEWVGGIAGEPVKVIRGPITGLPFPADAEIVLEGFASPTERIKEGPFGEWTGYYASDTRPEPVLNVQAVYYRDDPIVLGAPPNKPPDEQARYRAFLRSALLRDDIEKAGVPDVQGAWCHEVGGSRLFLAVSIKQRYAGHARQAGHVAAMCHAGAYLGRYVVVVDEDIDPTNLEDVLWAMCTRSDPERSLDLIKRAWSGPLDPAIHPDEKGHNSRLIIDACRPFEWRDKFPPVSNLTPEQQKVARERWSWLIQ
ncbi:MAG: UbiD family decarboxylase [Chloroflexi bacterium]|nr:UbiD family decarboxylase [Chloroflexota bacterium]